MNFFLKNNLFKLLFIEIHKFKKKKILEEDEDESNDQQSDAEATGNEGNVNKTLFAFLEWSQNCSVQMKATFDQRAAPLESQINMQPMSPSLKKPMIIVTNKYFRNL